VARYEECERSELRDSEAEVKKTVVSGSDKIRAEIVIKVLISYQGVALTLIFHSDVGGTSNRNKVNRRIFYKFKGLVDMSLSCILLLKA
jgi:hypothetical protein